MVKRLMMLALKRGHACLLFSGSILRVQPNPAVQSHVVEMAHSMVVHPELCSRAADRHTAVVKSMMCFHR